MKEFFDVSTSMLLWALLFVVIPWIFVVGGSYLLLKGLAGLAGMYVGG